MQVTDYPPGKFTLLMIGPYWPSGMTVTSTINAARNRGTIQSFFEDYMSQLSSTRTGALAPMEGATASTIRDLFNAGETHADSVAAKNGTKKKAFTYATDALNGLRSDLAQIAADGNAKIDEIQESKKDAAQKLAEIIDIIAEKQADAAHKSAQYGAKITEVIQQVLTAEGDTRPPEKFAADNGIDLDSQPIPPTKDKLGELIELLLKGSSDAAAGEAQLPVNTVPRPLSTQPNSQEDRSGGIVAPPPEVVSTPSPQATELSQPFRSDGVVTPPSVPGIHAEGHAPVAAGAFTGAPSQLDTGIPSLGASGGGSGLASGQPSLTSIPSSGLGAGPQGAGLPDVGHVLNPGNLAEGFNHGMQAGGPMSAGTEALSKAFAESAPSPFHPPVAHQPEFSTPMGTLSTATLSTSGGYISADSGQAGSAAPIAPAATTSPTVFAAPMASAAPISAAPPPMTPAGPLPVYGADLRHAATAMPSAPAPAAVAASASTPTSAPVSPSSGGVTQPAVVNRPAPAPAVAGAPGGLFETASAATTSGATAGAVSAHQTAKKRRRAFVEAVARQQPRLRWAIADLENGTTVLVTDIASGWIPPGVEIPTGVQLLPPAPRRGALEALLRDAILIETWAPGQYLGDNSDADPVPMSFRARDLPIVDDLNWAITHATNWRDGLPRLAHTLTKAGIAGTGILDAETDLLHEHVHAISETMLKAYPDSVDTAMVGNWQLLAAIDALVSGQRTALNYHFAWFQALHMARKD